MKSLVLILAVILCFFTSRPAEARKHKKFKGVIIVNQILKLRGTVKRNGEQAAEYSGIKQGDLLETGDKSEAVIRIPGLAIFRLGANTKVKLTQFADRSDSRLELLDGNLLALYRRQGEHELLLNHSVVKLHGTTFFALSPHDGKFDQLCLCDGKVEVVARDSADIKSGKKTAKNRKPQSEEVTLASTKATATPTATAVASATPLASPALGAVASATPNPTATMAPTPTPTPFPLPKELVMTSKWEHKMCEASGDGVEVKTDNKLLDLHTMAEIKDLESLYELP